MAIKAPNRSKKLTAYIAERNAVLLTGDWRKLKKFMIDRNMPLPSGGDEVIELTLHKSITAVPGLPLEFRLKSKRWLISRGGHSLDDGDLNLPASPSANPAASPEDSTSPPPARSEYLLSEPEGPEPASQRPASSSARRTEDPDS